MAGGRLPAGARHYTPVLRRGGTRAPMREPFRAVDDRILTSCAAVRARMDGWWTFARGSTTLHACLSTRRDKSNDAVTLDANDRSHGSMTWSARPGKRSIAWRGSGWKETRGSRGGTILPP